MPSVCDHNTQPLTQMRSKVGKRIPEALDADVQIVLHELCRPTRQTPLQATTTIMCSTPSLQTPFLQ